MIRISQIDDELSIYKNNTVVLLGLGKGFKQIYDLLRYYGIEINSICDYNEDNWGETHHGLKVISPTELKNMIEIENSNIAIQIAIKDIDDTIVYKLYSFSFKVLISYDEAWNVLTFMHKFKLVYDNPQIIGVYDKLWLEKNKIVQGYKALNYIAANPMKKDFLFICSIPKTGDYTLMKTFEEYNIDYFMTSHTPEIFNKQLIRKLNQKIKIIIGIREPISQNISFIYQQLGSLFHAQPSYLLHFDKEFFFQNGGDFQSVFEFKYINDLDYNYADNFFERFKKNVLDLSKYPFDKEKGYTIIKKKNIQIFVYQLEKMDDVLIELCNWIGKTKFEKYIIENKSSDKWISSSYIEAQKKIKISQEYFEKCYNDPWINHFYSKEDIEKFKNKWKTHIKF